MTDCVIHLKGVGASSAETIEANTIVFQLHLLYFAALTLQ